MRKATTRLAGIGGVVAVLLGGCTSLPDPGTAETRNSPSSNNSPVTDPDNSAGTKKGQHTSPDGEMVGMDLLVINGRSPSLERNTSVSDSNIETRSVPANLASPAYDNDLWQRLRSEFSLPQPAGSEEKIARFENWYARHPSYFERLAERAHWFMPYILDEIDRRDMPVELALVPVIESAYRPDATSRSQAVGLWQMIGATGRRFGLRQDWWMDGRRDLGQSTRAALDYFDFLSREFDGDWSLALAGYNAGEGNIRKALRRNAASNQPTIFSALDLRRETEDYVPRLFAIRNIINDPAKFGITLNTIPDLPTLKLVDARVQTDLSVAASIASMSADHLRYLNMGYKRGVTPPAGPHLLMVPVDQADTMLASLNSLSHQQRMRWARHKVRKGEYLGRIARNHGVSVNAIISANQLGSNLIQPGQELKIPLSDVNYQFARASLSDVTPTDGDRIYTIRPGDTLWKISRTFSTSLSNILNWNGLSKSSVIQPGQKLVIERN